MKPHDLANLLRGYLRLPGVGAQSSNRAVALLAEALDRTPGATVTAAVGKLRKAAAVGERGVPSLGQAAEGLRPMADFIRLCSKAAANDLDRVQDVLETYPSVAISTFDRVGTDGSDHSSSSRADRSRSSGIREEVVADYVSRLLAAIGDRVTFPPIFRALQSKGAVSAAELKAIAKHVTVGGFTSKDEALRRIWNRHQAVVGTDRRISSAGGRSAA